MQTIAIVNEKGGTGKTTTAVNLSAALGQLGKSVLLVDLDGQAASSRWLGVEDDDRFADALWQGEGLDPIQDVIPGVSLAPGSGKLDSVSHDLRPTQGGQLRKLLSGMDGYDYSIIDCPPSLGNRLIGNALLAASHAIVPVETSILALDGLKILLTTFEDVRQGFGHDIILTGVLACRYDARTRLSRLILNELHRALPGKVFKTVIRENVRVRECPGSGQSILTYAPTSHAAEDYMSLARELVGLGAEGALVADGQEPAAVSDLTAEQRTAVSEMRTQVDTLVREFDQHCGAPAPEEPQPDAAPADFPQTLAPEQAAAEGEESTPESEEVVAEPMEFAPQGEESAPEPEEAPAEPMDFTAKLEQVPSEPMDFTPTPEESAPEPVESTPQPEPWMTKAQSGPYAGAFPAPDGDLTPTDEEGGEESSPEHLSGVGAEASLNQVPVAAGGDESIRPVNEAARRAMRAIDHAHSIIGRNGTGRAHGDLHKADQVDQPWDGHAEPPAVEPPPVEMPADETPAVEPPPVEMPAPEPPAYEMPADEMPAVEPPAYEMPAVEPPAAEMPADEPAAVEAPPVEMPADEPAAVEPPPVEMPADEPAAVEPPAVEMPADEPAAVEPPADEMPADEQPDSAGADSPEPAEAPVGASEDYPALREMLRSMPPGSDNTAAPGQMPEQSAEEPGWRRIFRKMAGVK